jgi:hypothetical protein
MNWVQRINVIHEVAKLLKFIHDQEKQNMVLNISASHILLDKVSTLPWAMAIMFFFDHEYLYIFFTIMFLFLVALARFWNSK